MRNKCHSVDGDTVWGGMEGGGTSGGHMLGRFLVSRVVRSDWGVPVKGKVRAKFSKERSSKEMVQIAIS